MKVEPLLSDNNFYEHTSSAIETIDTLRVVSMRITSIVAIVTFIHSSRDDYRFFLQLYLAFV